LLLFVYIFNSRSHHLTYLLLDVCMFVFVANQWQLIYRDSFISVDQVVKVQASNIIFCSKISDRILKANLSWSRTWAKFCRL